MVKYLRNPSAVNAEIILHDGSAASKILKSLLAAIWD